MDLLFKRYASPFDYLNELIELGCLEDGLLNILYENEEEKKWQMYLSIVPYVNKSFDDWKKAIYKQTPIGLKEEEVKTQINKSNEILKNFKL